MYGLTFSPRTVTLSFAKKVYPYTGNENLKNRDEVVHFRLEYRKINIKSIVSSVVCLKNYIHYISITCVAYIYNSLILFWTPIILPLYYIIISHNK